MTRKAHKDYMPTQSLEMDFVYDAREIEPRTNIMGNTYGRLTVSPYFMRRLISTASTGIVWRCTCSCGKTTWVYDKSFINGKAE